MLATPRTYENLTYLISVLRVSVVHPSILSDRALCVYMIQYGKGNLTWNTYGGKVRGFGWRKYVDKTHRGFPKEGRIFTNLVPWLNSSSEYPWADVYTAGKPPMAN